MKIVGRLSQTPIRECVLVKAFHRNALQFAAIVSLVLFSPVDSSRAAEMKIWQEFSGEKALAHVQRLVDFGPRPAGSAAIERARAYIKEQLASFGWTITEQSFTDQTPRGQIRFINLIARFSPSHNKPDLPVQVPPPSF